MDKPTLKEEKRELLKTLGRIARYNSKRLIRTLIICITLLITLFLLLPTVFRIMEINITSEDYSWVNTVLYTSKLFLTIIIAVALLSLIKQKLIPNIGRQRNIHNLIDSLESNDVRAPITDRETLLRRIIGENATPKTKFEINTLIEENINSIKGFMFNDEKTLIVDGKWGVGKTTYTLISLNEISSDKRLLHIDYRFIYESSFKYISEFSEFKRDILKIIKSILSEQKIFVPFDFAELVNNISSSTVNIAISEYKTSKTTTDIVNKLNSKYKKKKSKKGIEPFKIIIIIDDMDRLQGEEIIQALAFLSIIRRLHFIKIILPIDRNVIIDQLEKTKITEPQIYINKYLPEQSSVLIRSDYNLITMIFSKKIQKELGVSYNIAQIEPILECFYVKLFADRLKHNMTSTHVDSLDEWPKYGTNDDYPKELLDNDSFNSKYIFDARNYLQKHIKNIYKDNNVLGYIGTANNFESIIYLMKFKNKRPNINNTFPLRVDDELYRECIKSWVLPFTEAKWTKLRPSIREIDDIFNHNIQAIKKLLDTKMKPHEIFVRTYNVIFPDWPITDEMLYEE